MRIRRLLLSDPPAQIAEDLDAVQRIAAASPEAAAWDRAGYQAIIENPAGGAVWIAQVDQASDVTVVGFACVRVAADEAELLNLAVDPSHRRQAIGSLLMERIIAEAAAAGARRLFLEVRASNTAALRLYQHHGFEEIGRRRGYFPETGTGEAEDAVVLARTLSWPS